MSVSLEKSSSLASRFRDALPSILKNSRHTEIWGIDLKDAEGQVLEVILEKVLGSQIHRDSSLNSIVPQKSFRNPRTSSL